MFNTYITGGQNIIGLVSELNQIGQQITVGDFVSLAQFLSDYGIHPAEVQELQDALEDDGPPPEEGNFGSKVKEWVGGMVQKAASGVWKISLDVATNVLTKGLFQYYGWN